MTFNGVECSPVPIDAVEYINGNIDLSVNRLQSRTITGVCKIKTNGLPIVVGFNIGKCNGSDGGGDAYTGWNSATRIHIEEVNPPQQ